MSTIAALPLHLRPREKLIAKGPENLKDYELLAVLLRVGVKGKSAIDLARIILDHYPLHTLFDTTTSDLKQIKGIDVTKIATLQSAFELSKRALGKRNTTIPQINCPQDAVNLLSEYRNKTKEHFIVLYLNARNEVIHKEVVSKGTINSSLVHPREVFEPAIRCLASSVILAHNHPSNTLDPSKEDILITEKLVRSGRILDIEVIDHFIITQESFFSFKQKGLINGTD